MTSSLRPGPRRSSSRETRAKWIKGEKTRPDRGPARDLALLRAFPPRPIRCDDEHRHAIAVVNGLLDRPALGADEEDYLDVPGLLIADYEDAIYEHPDFTPSERLRRLMEEHSLTQAERARRAQVAVTSLSDILNGKRRISPRNRARFAECFGVSASFFAWDGRSYRRERSTRPARRSDRHRPRGYPAHPIGNDL